MVVNNERIYGTAHYYEVYVGPSRTRIHGPSIEGTGTDRTVPIEPDPVRSKLPDPVQQ